MARDERVLKFDRSDDGSQYVLVNVVHKGPKSLDVKIQATEGEAEYATTLKHDKIASLAVKNGPASGPEWEQILERLLQQDIQEDIQATATVSPDSSISIVVRRSVQGITQRLGTLTIPIIPGGELNVLDWCATAVDTAAESKKAALEASVKAEELETAVSDLRQRLDELIQAKEEDETTLLLKFRDLLNEKKVKIREQQKIIVSSNIGSNGASSTEPTQTTLPARDRIPGQSRASKRKAGAAPEVGESSSDGFEHMNVDRVKSEDTDDGDGTDATASTASGDEEEDAPGNSDDDDDDDRDMAAPAANQPARETRTPAKTQAQPPPKRSLPFAKGKPQPPTAPGPAGSDTESDDEL